MSKCFIMYPFFRRTCPSRAPGAGSPAVGAGAVVALGERNVFFHTNVKKKLRKASIHTGSLTHVVQSHGPRRHVRTFQCNSVSIESAVHSGADRVRGDRSLRSQCSEPQPTAPGARRHQVLIYITALAGSNQNAEQGACSNVPQKAAPNQSPPTGRDL